MAETNNLVHINLYVRAIHSEHFVVLLKLFRLNMFEFKLGDNDNEFSVNVSTGEIFSFLDDGVKCGVLDPLLRLLLLVLDSFFLDEALLDVFLFFCSSSETLLTLEPQLETVAPTANFKEIEKLLLLKLRLWQLNFFGSMLKLLVVFVFSEEQELVLLLLLLILLLLSRLY